MGELLSKLEQLFTPSISCPSTTSTAGISSPLNSAHAVCPTSDSDSTTSSSTSSSRCYEFVGSILSRIRQRKDEVSVAMANIGATLSGATAVSGKKGVVLPFDELPVVCKMKVMSFLTLRQRGVAAQVCREWNELVRSPSLWTDVDFTQISSSTESTIRRHRYRFRHDSSRDIYDQRVTGYLTLLGDIAPPVHRLRFVYDIATNHNRFLTSLGTFLLSSRCGDLQSASLIWDRSTLTTTTAGSLGATTADHRVAPTSSDVSRQRCRQRLFVQFFQAFVAYAPNIRCLHLPFDWSARSVQSLVCLSQLERLKLGHYFEYPALNDSLLGDVLSRLTRLRHLTLEVWSASGAGLLPFSLRSDSLECVDVSACRGFVIVEATLPRLRSLRVSRHQWCGPLESGNAAAVANQNFPCLHEVLSAGAPGLEEINEHRLRADWRYDIDAGLDRLLKDICACQLHYRAESACAVAAVAAYGKSSKLN